MAGSMRNRAQAELDGLAIEHGYQRYELDVLMGSVVSVVRDPHTRQVLEQARATLRARHEAQWQRVYAEVRSNLDRALTASAATARRMGLVFGLSWGDQSGGSASRH